MSLNNASITALNSWATTQNFASFGQQDGNPATSANLAAMGTLWDSGKMVNDTLRDVYVYSAHTAAASTGSTVTTDKVMLVPPRSGTLVSLNVVCPNNWSTTTAAASQFTMAVRTFNSALTSALTTVYDFTTGLAGGTLGLIPTNNSYTSQALLTSAAVGTSISVATANLYLTTGTAFVNVPNVGDYISVNASSTLTAGATYQNAGIYKVVSVDSSNQGLTATKLFGANPQNVASATTNALDVTGFVLVRGGNPLQITAGEMVGIEIVQAASTVNLSNIPLTFVWQIRPS